jgi:predicted transcriptional regulator
MAKPPKEMSEEPGVFDSEEISSDDIELDAATLRGLADIEAGRVVSHEAVLRWVKSWSSPNPLPRPKCGE